jgi:hypothetical protein
MLAAGHALLLLLLLLLCRVCPGHQTAAWRPHPMGGRVTWGPGCCPGAQTLHLLLLLLLLLLLGAPCVCPALLLHLACLSC